MKIEQITDKITLIHGDCMEYMATLGDKDFQLACVDPPFGKGQATKEIRNERGRFSKYKGVGRTGGTWAAKYGSKIKEWDIAPTPPYFNELYRVSENQVIWGANYFENMPPTRGFIVWRKKTISEKFTMAMCEYAWTSFDRNAKVFECMPQGTKADPRIHVCQKPIPLYKWLFENYAKQGDRILDTHLGSASSAIAAYDLGYEFVGIEIDEEYYENAKARLLRHIASQQPTLF